jgi:membrane protein implicated in regulation of membrane protease activity
MDVLKELPWWLWAVGSLLLMAVELAAPGTFFFIFFAAGALITAIAKLVAPSLSPVWALILFCAASSVSMVFFRQKLLKMRLFREPDPTNVDALSTTMAVALENIDPNNHGKVELRGAPWTALNAGKFMLRKGQRCKVTKVEGLNLEVTSE